MADFNNQWIEIFRTGDYGAKGSYTADDLDKMVANFAHWHPPLVLGHPENNSPAMGWAAQIKRDGQRLLALTEKVQPQLEAHVADGRFPNRSIAIYQDPKGSGPAVRHIGFLGATPPEVKGLAPIQFSDGDFIAIDFNEEDDVDKDEVKKTVAAEIKAFFSSLFGERQPAAQFTEEQVQERITAALKPVTDAMNALATKFTESQTAIAAQQTAGLAAMGKAKAAALVAKLKAGNQWVPAFTEAGMESTLENLAVSGAMIKFGEAGKEKEISAFDSMAGFLESQPKIVPTGAMKIKTPKGKVVQFNESRGIQVDANSAALKEAAEELMSKNAKLTFGEALKQARSEQPELAQPVAVGQV